MGIRDLRSDLRRYAVYRAICFCFIYLDHFSTAPFRDVVRLAIALHSIRAFSNTEQAKKEGKAMRTKTKIKAGVVIWEP